MTKGLKNGWQVGEASSDFDVRRAFAHGEYMGALREQERIIKLLKELWETTYAKGSTYPGSNAVLDAIALIKGEQK